MVLVGAPLLATLLFWWGSTALILYLATRGGLGRRALLPGGVLAVLALTGMVLAREQATALGAFISFTCGLVLWGWIELSYLTGLITGPARWQRPCPSDATEGRRFLLGIGTSLYHELSVVASGSLLLWLCAGAENAVGAWTFTILWLMRWSAKLNLFLGVPRVNVEFFPPHLQFLETYMARRSLNLLFPVSVTAGTFAAALLLDHGFSAAAAVEQVTGLTLGVLLALAVLEHWFMLLPIRDAELWSWALPREPREEAVPVARS